MPDQPSSTVPRDCDHVDLSNPGELEYWVEEFGITPEHLQHIVARRGNDVVELRAMLEK